MEPAESKYAHLLQPIRELTKNWEIDVASELNDYLEELDETTITFDGGKTSLNFAEAALLIQGSTYIYSKKVELLHSLVCQTLEYINDKNKKKSQKAAQAQDNAAGASQSSHDADDMAVFTPLELEVSENSQKSDLSANVRVVPLPPESLIPPETHEKKRLPLISVKGEVVCSQKDFRMNLFIPGQDDLIQLILQSAAASRFLLDRSLEPPETQYAAEAEASGVPDDAAESFLPVEADMDVEQDPEEHVERQQSQAAAEGRMMRERRRVEVVKQEEPPPAAVNVWAQHDPYSAVGEDKRFKAGRCYKVPEGLDDRGKRKRKPAALLLDFGSWFRGTCDPPKQKLKVSPTFPDLNYIYLSAIKHRVRNLKRTHRRAGVMMSEKEIQRTFLQLEEAGPHQPGAEPVDELLGGEDDGSDAEQDGLPDDGPAEFGADLVPAEARGDELTYEELVNLRVEQLVKHCQGYTQQTALSRRVKDWEDKIQPELVLQEQRPPFDIHDYGERIVEKLHVVSCRRTFASIVQGLDNFEACKYLLASLQLANDHTVEVDSAAGLEDSMDTMALTLLSTHRATDRFIALGGLS